MMYIVFCAYLLAAFLMPDVECYYPEEWSSAQLVDGTSEAGRLELSKGYGWIPVCATNFGHKEAQLACKMLAFNRTEAAAAVGSVHYGSVSQTESKSDWVFSPYTPKLQVSCKGTEVSLHQCSLSHVYDCKEAVAVICNIKLRLQGTRHTRQDVGLVEVYIRRKWQTVCVSNNKMAKVVCRQLGLPTGAAKRIAGWTMGPTRSPEINFFFTCKGNEHNFFQCGHSVEDDRGSCISKNFGVFCSHSPSLYIVSVNDSFPLMAGRNAALKCLSPSNYTTAKRTWSETAGGHPVGNLLIFNPLTRAHHGRQVSCTSTTFNNLLNETLELKVYYNPIITITRNDNLQKANGTSPKNIYEIIQGENVTFDCQADSNPAPASITWFGRVNSNTSTLRIISAEQMNHDGVYTCTVDTSIIDDDDRLPLMSFYQLTITVKVKPCGTLGAHAGLR